MSDNTIEPIFTNEMKATHTLLMPMMVEPHFSILQEVLRLEGYKVELLAGCAPSIPHTGLRYVHNDMCYPAILVIGQFIEALQSGRYDLEHTALLMTQTGGGCRASNYLYLLRKALRQSGFGDIPVVSCNFGKLDSNTLNLTPRLVINFLYAVIYGDFLHGLYNQVRSHEVNPGSSREALDTCVSYLLGEMRAKRLRGLEKHLRHMLAVFERVPSDNILRPRVGIVGEIYLKYSPLGNNQLEEFLIEQGAEPVVSGLMDFALYCMHNTLMDEQLYGKKPHFKPIAQAGIALLTKKQQQIERIITQYSRFMPPHSFKDLVKCADGVVSRGIKMGEGWLLGAEIASHIEHGAPNVVCAQPFGCLPNHIASKGVMGNIRAKYPQANLVTVDYDSGACRINQENRLKLMLMNAQAHPKRTGTADALDSQPTTLPIPTRGAAYSY